MKKSRIIVVAAVGFGLITLILLNNRSKISAKSRNDFQAAIPVSVTQVKPLTVSESLSLVGTIAANSDVALVAEVPGKVTAVLAKVGDFLKAGSPVIQIDDEVRKAAYEQAKANYDRAKRDYERFSSLRDEQAVTESQKENAFSAFKSAEAQFVMARKQYRDTRVTTPIAGVLTARNVDLGTMVSDKMVVANVVDVARLKVKLNVAERDAFKLRVGDRVEVTTDVYPGVTQEGRITSISAKADEGHTYPVEIGMSNSPSHPLRAGMFGRVSFVSIAPMQMLAIPREALVGSLREARVFVLNGAIARKRSIVVGDQTGSDLTVLAGLASGDTIVVNGQNNLKDSVLVEILR